MVFLKDGTTLNRLNSFDRLDCLMTEADKIIDEVFPNGIDPGSPIPNEYQHIRQYFLNEKGVHALSTQKGELSLDTIYPIPFIVTMDKIANIHFYFFINKEVVLVDSDLDRFIEQYFHSLSDKERLAIKRYASVCIMRRLKKPE